MGDSSGRNISKDSELSRGQMLNYSGRGTGNLAASAVLATSTAQLQHSSRKHKQRLSDHNEIDTKSDDTVKESEEDVGKIENSSVSTKPEDKQLEAETSEYSQTSSNNNKNNQSNRKNSLQNPDSSKDGSEPHQGKLQHTNI